MGSSQTPLTTSGFDGYYAQLQESALKATKHAAGLPADLAFHRSVDSDLASALEMCSSKVVAITNTLLGLASTIGSSKSSKGKGKARVQDEDDIVDRFSTLVVEPMDQLLERADIALDRFSGRTKEPAIAINLQESKKKAASSSRHAPVIQHVPHLPKPQLKFKRKPDNTNGVPRHPTLRHKFNAQVPLGYNFQSVNDGKDSDRALSPHPYHYETQNLAYPAHMFQSQTPIPYRALEETPFTWVSTRAQLEELIDKLREAKEVAVDLEYHSYRTYRGFVCLMQISTREEDWIVDPFELRDELEDLNDIFTNPNIVKVLHGAESDVVWLQQDFNLYLVNIFDTFHASKVLEFPRHGLGTLLEMYCDFSPDKRYQLADWRIRPLSNEMLKYARADTHFLLYVYDNLRNALLDRAVSRSASPTSRASSPVASETFVREVLSRSAETSLRVYSPEPYDAEGGTGQNGWDTLARRWNKPTLFIDGMPSVQREVFRAVHVWRDRVAREEDESTGYTLSNRFLFMLVEKPPADMAALLHAFSSMPPVVRRRAKELLDVIRDAVKKGLSHTAEESGSPLVVTSEATRGLSKEENDVSSPLPLPAQSTSTSLWYHNKEFPTTATSSLFGFTNTTSGPHPAYSTTYSSLFGSIPPAAAKLDARSRFHDVVNRIHSTLVIVPTVSAAPPAGTTVTSTEVGATATTETPTSAAIAEIPFVPASLRQAVKTEIVDDAIISVGQRQKKRKRTKKAEVDSGSGDTPSTPVAHAKAEPAQEIVPFDFASVPNILDDAPGEFSEQEGRRTGKRLRSRKGAVVERDGFPAAPKDRREVRSGNMTHTFRP